MESFEIRFHQIFAKRVHEELAKETAHLCNGIATDYADYRYRAGQIEMANRLLGLATLIEREMLGKKPAA